MFPEKGCPGLLTEKSADLELAAYKSEYYLNERLLLYISYFFVPKDFEKQFIFEIRSSK